MKSLLIHRDGRLRVGLVTLLAFGLLLTLGTLVLKCREPIDQAVVAVQQVWEPAAEPPASAQNKPETASAPATPADTLSEEVPAAEEPQNEQSASTAATRPLGTEKAETAPMSAMSALNAEIEQQNAGTQAATQPDNSRPPRAEPQEQGAAEPAAADGKSVASPVAKTVVKVAEPVTALAAPTLTDKPTELSVDGEKYLQLLDGWRNSGVNTDVPDRVALQVTDLRDSYALFQMKPVAVLDDGQIIDLSDGSRLPAEILESYSATVFFVDRPWDKWGKALQAAGLNRNQGVKVRYYMYEFIRRAIYARCQQALSWCCKQGLLDSNVTPDQIEVLGRTFAIRRQGGGQFGVFVPVQLTAPGVRQLAIDPAAFADQPDIAAVRRAGLL